jgi:amidase
MEPCFLTASQAARLYETGELTVTELATSTLARIRARDEAVKGWAYLDEDLVMQRASELDSIPKSQRGPLHGITIAVKDVIYTKGMSPVLSLPRLTADIRIDMPTQHNSPMYRDSFPELDAGEYMP